MTRHLAILCLALAVVGCAKQQAKIVYVSDEIRLFSAFDGSTTVQFDDGSVKQFRGILGTTGMWVRVRK